MLGWKPGLNASLPSWAPPSWMNGSGGLVGASSLQQASKKCKVANRRAQAALTTSSFRILNFDCKIP